VRLKRGKLKPALANASGGAVRLKLIPLQDQAIARSAASANSAYFAIKPGILLADHPG
jgi:hypothetical protein